MMGMGEPLLNLTNIVTAIEIMLDDFGFGLSKRRITISTAGIAPAINKLGSLIDVTLAISLHAPTDEIRNKIMPINYKYNIKALLTSVNNYIMQSNSNRKRVTIEYVMLDQINDSIENAYQLIRCLKNIPCKINLIPWNKFFGVSYNSSSKKQINIFSRILIEHGFITFIRNTRGNDINAACGQLVGKVINHTKKYFPENLCLKL